MNNENECGSAKHCNLILLLCGDTLISNSQFSIFHFEREGFDGHCSFHCTLCYALYQKHRPVSDAAGTGLLDLRHAPHLLGNAQSGDGAGRLDEKPVCTGCRDHSRSGGVCRAQSDRLGKSGRPMENIRDRQYSAAVSAVYAARHRGQRPACMAQSGRDKPAAG